MKLMSSYNDLRQQYLPSHIKFLLIAESPPPAASIPSSRHFYRSDAIRTNDRLFTNTIKSLYPEATDKSEPEIQKDKEHWLRRFQQDGWYMIEALKESQKHEATKQQRRAKIQASLPELIERVRKLVDPDTKIILIKSNVFDVAAKPLRQAGFKVLNTELVDYPGRFNQRNYRQKLATLAGNDKGKARNT